MRDRLVAGEPTTTTQTSDVGGTHTTKRARRAETGGDDYARKASPGGTATAAAPKSKIPGLEAAIFDLDGVVLATERIHAKAWSETINQAIAYIEKNRAALEASGAVRFERPNFSAFTHEDYLDYVDGKDRYVGTESFFVARGIHLDWGQPKDEGTKRADLWNIDSPEHLTISGISNTKNVLVNRMIDAPASKDEELVIFQSTIDRIREFRAAGVRIAAASSSQNAKKVLGLAGALDLFDAIACGLDITDSKTQSKPSPYLFLEAAKKLGVKPDKAIVFEDAQSGVQAGRAGGFKAVVGIARKPENAPKLAQYADVVVPDLADLPMERIARLVAPKTAGKRAHEVRAEAVSPKKGFESEILPAALRFTGFDPKAEKTIEVLSALGNGYMGMRSSLAALGLGPIGEQAFYVAGLFNKIEGETADLVNLPAWSSLEIHDGKEKIDLAQGKVKDYQRELDMETGLLKLKLVYEGKSGRRTQIEIEQFMSAADTHAGAARFSITPLNYSDTIRARSAFDPTVTNNGSKHLDVQGSSSDPAARTSSIELVTNGSKITVREAVRLDVAKEAASVQKSGDGLEVAVALKKGERTSIDKIALVSTSRKTDQRIDAGAAVRSLPGFEALKAASDATWTAMWKKTDVKISGDDRAQQAIRFMIYHLFTLGHGSDGTTNIGAKGLSNTPGSGYRGHVFWDTEIFMLPFFTYTAPEIAKELLAYRHNTIAEAKNKAKSMGYEGALYAWESTDTGAEETPKWGGDIRIWCGETEQHISADVAYAVDQYARVTGDDAFMRKEGAEIMLETARFWASRPVLNETTGQYEIHTVIGPDEFHEGPGRNEGGVDNSVYTNTMARWNIRRAIEIVDALPAADRSALLAKVGIPEGYEAWKTHSLDVASKLKINFDPKSKLFEQFDGYFDLVDPLNSEFTKEWVKEDGRFIVHTMDAYLREKYKKHGASWTQINKQADIVMMLTLLSGQFDPQVASTNFDYYAPRTSHGSSLSNAMHAILAARLGRADLAERYLHDALITDLGDEKGNSSGGIHAASLGGAWQAIVNGFGGVTAEADRLKVAPRMKRAWDALSFGLTYRGVPLEVEEKRDAGHVPGADAAKKRRVVKDGREGAPAPETALDRLLAEVKRQRSPAKPEIDLRPGSPTLGTMEAVAKAQGVDFAALEKALCAAFHVDSLEALGNKGMPDSAALRTARDLGHDFPDVLRAVGMRLASLSTPERALGTASPQFVRAIWANLSLYSGSRYLDEETIADRAVDSGATLKTLRESVAESLRFVTKKLDADKSSGASLPLDVQADYYDALVYGAELLRQSPGPDGPHKEASLATAAELEARAASLKAAFFSGFAAKSKASFVLGRVLDSRLFDGREPEAVRVKRALVNRVAKEMRASGGLVRENGRLDLSDNMAVVHGLLRQGETAKAKALMNAILAAYGKGVQNGEPGAVSAAWASASYLADQALLKGPTVAVRAQGPFDRAITLEVGGANLELSKERPEVSVALERA